MLRKWKPILGWPIIGGTSYITSDFSVGRENTSRSKKQLRTSFQLYFLILAFLTFGGAQFAAAADVMLTPQLTLRGAYDDNILMSRDDETSSSIATVSPSVQMDYKTLLSSLRLNADVDILRYFQESDLNRTNQYYRLSGDHRLKERWTTSADLKFFRDTTLHTYLEETGRVIDRVERDYLEAGGGLAYDLTTVSEISAAYEYRTVSYETDDFSDYDNHIASLYYAHHLKNERDTLSIGPSYYKRTTDFSDVDSFSLDLGWARNWSEVTKVSAAIGGRYTKVKNDDGLEDDSMGVKAKLDITSRGLASTTIFRYFHDIRTTVDGNDINVDNFLIDYRRLITERFGVGINGRLVFSYKLFDEQSELDDERYYWVEPRLFYKLKKNMDLSLHYRYHNNVRFRDEGDINRERNITWVEFSYAIPTSI